MPYSNSFSRRNPGFLVIMIDQSGSLSATKQNNGLELAEIVAKSVNYLINELILKLVTVDANGNEIVRRSIKICLIGYGSPNNEAHIICNKWIDEIADGYPFNKLTINTREGSFEQYCIEVLHPISEGIPNISDAMSIAKDLVSDWMCNHNKVEDAVPYIINITNDCTPDNGETIKIVNEISEMHIPDGSPLVINCFVSNNTPFHTNPFEDSFYVDNTQFLYKISSETPTNMKERMREYGFETEKLFIHISNYWDLLEFLWQLFPHPMWNPKLKLR